MKTIIIYILSCLSVFGAGTSGIRVVTTTDTNTLPGIVVTMDVFTRDGQTNLVRETHIKDGVLQSRTQTFYHDGVNLGSYTYFTGMANGLTVAIHSEANVSYAVSYSLDASNKTTMAVVGTDDQVLDAFSCTNGVFYPESAAFIHISNSLLNGQLPH